MKTSMSATHLSLQAPAGAMPRIIAWFSVDAIASLFEYHDGVRPKGRADIISLNSIYRIMKSVPDLVTEGNK